MRKNLMLLLLLFNINARAQQTANRETVLVKKMKTLNIGDKVPNILIPKIINDRTSSARIADFKDQLLIIDFWDTNCSGCVAALPRMEALQKKFGTAVKILPVTPESESMIRAFLKKNKHTRDLNISSAVEDKALARLFPYALIPHEVWIYKGKLVAITEYDYVDSAHIRFILDGKKNNWFVKNDFIQPVDTAQSFLTINKDQYPIKDGPVKYAALFGYRPDLYGAKGVSIDTVRHTRRTFFSNLPILAAYYTYWAKAKGISPFYLSYNQLILEVRDSSRFTTSDESRETMSDYRFSHQVCYESVVPDKGETEQEQAMTVIRDLDYLLGLHGRFENRKTRCLVLVQSGSGDQLKPPAQLKEGNQHVKVEQGSSLDFFVEYLNKFKNMPRIFNEANYKGEYYMELEINSYNDIPALRKALQQYGLDLKEEERELEMFVLTQKNYHEKQ